MCIKGKQTRNPNKHDGTRATKLLKLIHSDVLGPIEDKPFSGARYLVTYVDDNLLTYLAITSCYRSWPQLICGAIRHELLQLGANFGYPAFLDSHQPVWPNAGEAVLVCDNHHLAQIRRLYELGWSYPYERYDPAIEDVVF